ncbi:mismatch-specific DNA-glycosylase [Herbiconiux ginsengi]|uniref:G/U mismatch-specific uracil-DNA glycosylase n=1 Tax=Herbiconiux ginsengi TaxID=381665 RepID=A0A1H3K5L4_9MICO|nr:mismatch-specific DNA-glycosylase [Herbiconiux ginsengi]SDY47139.1 G/U mismatch-specific uracil-DNA glycosylase [Herbiconiux ginsengi]
MGFTRAELESYRGKPVPDVRGDGLRLLIVGINPGLHTAAVQAPFSRRGNRFYAALYRAGILDHVIDASEGFQPGDREHLIARGVGLTSLVAGATARADELSTRQLLEGAAALESRVAELRPAVVAMLGITAYRIAFSRPHAVVGRQPETLAGAELWVVPNPSGLNAHESVDSLAVAYREVAIAAGIPVYPQPIS